MTKDKTFTPAFPQLNGGDLWTEDSGMSLRDYFAAQALTGIQQWDALVNERGSSAFIGKGGIALMAKIAYEISDAMLLQREK